MARAEINNRFWRVLILVLLLVAFLGPWSLDVINVPSKYECSTPFIRIEGDFCGKSISGIWIYPWIVISFFSSTVGLISGDLTLTRWINGFLIFIPVLPIFSTLYLILWEDHPRKLIFAIVTWILAVVVGLFWGLNNYPKLFWLSWGIWLYIGVAISALIFEILALISKRKFNQIG